MKALALGAASVAVLSWAAPALAADADAEGMTTAVTVTAIRTAKPVDEVPATVSVISSDQIDDELAQDVKDLVRYEPGVTVPRSPNRVSAANGTGRDGDSGFNIRGLEGNRVLITEDGVRVPDAFSFGPQSIGRGDYGDLGLYKSVEILRGPASALYGSDGVAGAVSFITKDPVDFLRSGRDFGAEARVSYNSADDSFGKSAVIAGRSGAFSAMLSYSRRDGHEYETNGDNGAANITRTKANPQDATSNAVMGKLVYDIAGNQRLRLTVVHFDSDLDTDVLSARVLPPLAASSTVGLNLNDTLKRDRVGLDYLWTADAGPVRSLKLATWWQQGKTVQYSFEDRNTSADRTRRSTYDNRVAGFSAEAQSRFTLAGIDNHLTYGGDVSKTHQEGVRDGTVPPFGETFPTRAFPITDYTLAGIFVQDEITLLEGRLSLYPALRYDAYDLKPKTDAILPSALTPSSQSDDRLSPKFGVVFRPADGWNLFVNYAQGFKAPAPSQVNNAFTNLSSGYTSIPNPDLKAETSETWEGGVRWKNDRVALSGTVFTGKYDNFIDQTSFAGTGSNAGLLVFQYVNLRKVKINGIEGSARAILGHGFTANLAASYARGDVDQSGAKTALFSIEPAKVVAGVSWRQGEGRYGAAFSVTHSDGKDVGRTGLTCTASCFTGKAFTTGDLTAFWRVTDFATLRAGVFNITDEKYWRWSDIRGLSTTSTTLDAYTQPGRNAAVSLTLRY